MGLCKYILKKEVVKKIVKMLATTLFRQQALRCGLQKFNKNQALIKISKTSSTLVPSQFLATTAVQRSGDHVKLWTAERFVSLAQIPALIVPFVWTNFGTDVAFCTLAVLHSHWGVEAIVVDYVRPSLFGGSTTIPNICQGLVWALSGVTLGGLIYFAYTDVGIINAIKMLWKL